MLQAAIGSPLIAIHGYTAPQLGVAFSRAHALCYKLNDEDALFATLSGKFVFHFVKGGDYGEMQSLVAETHRAAVSTKNSSLRLAANRLSALTAMHAGDFLQAQSDFEMILRDYEPHLHRPPPVHYVHDPKISALPYLAIVLSILGRSRTGQGHEPRGVWVEVDPIGGTTGSAFLIGSAAVSDPLSHHATRPVCCCCGCGPVGNASALSKLRPWRSVMSTALSPRAPVTPSRQTAIGVRLPNAW